MRSLNQGSESAQILLDWDQLFGRIKFENDMT
jgi:hypothetical protein